MSTKTIGQVLEGYAEAKHELQEAVQDVVSKAKELGLDPKVAEDVRVSVAYLHGYTRSPRRKA